MLEYEVKAQVENGGKAHADANKSIIHFDATSGRDEVLPNPAELLLTAFAACISKNIQRYSEILNIPYSKARIHVHGIRNENPPFIKEINYMIEIETDADEKKLNNWYKNILKFGTITNTLSKACKVSGKMVKI